MLRIVLLTGAIGILVGCSTPSARYIVALKDGRQIESKGWPELNERTGYYHWERKDGSLAVFREAQVASISENRPSRG